MSICNLFHRLDNVNNICCILDMFAKLNRKIRRHLKNLRKSLPLFQMESHYWAVIPSLTMLYGH